MRFDEALGDVQPKPEALAGDGARRLTTEPLEQRRHQLRCDARALIRDRHDNTVSRAFDIDRHVGIRVTVTNGVGEEVVEDLMNPVVIGTDRWYLAAHAESNPCCRCQASCTRTDASFNPH